MPDQSEAPIVRKLLRPAHNSWGDADGYRNPDGPEAAEIIRLCEEALKWALMRIDDRTDGYCAAEQVLAQIKGQNP